ncbi:Fe-S protein assembly co-chaperone HscB [Chondromyces crocatus]|uniref:Co-chaperone protein HscB homolog n=1 Tax=Chondromyces crocatus TaxID=52 RepID=A0A0K1E9H0_CHOCO|nr:Fe-S protein assembly co-chaperone HscB [Chondromyces crocatus]AKT37515.1 Fe-S protein assembly co-chaperone HscB [Chondromyces crocatus]
MKDPFAILGVEPRFTLDLRAVEQRHRELSRALHPDRYAGAPAAERRLSLGRAIEVNEAWRVVRDPIRRAEALMARSGVELREDAMPKADPAFLMEVMELREELSEAARRKDRARVEALGTQVRAREEASLAALGTVLDGSAGDRTSIEKALPRLSELKYFRRFLDEVSAIEEDLTDALP